MIPLFLVIGAALAISFTCSILEAVLLSVTQPYVAVLRERGERAGALWHQMRENIDEPIAAILTLNTIGHTVGATVGGALALQAFGSKWIALFSAVLTFAILVFSEIVPKTLGARYWKKLSTPTAYTLRGLTTVMKPVLVPLGVINRLLTPQGETGPRVSRAELEALADIGRQEGAIDDNEWQVVTNVINLDQVRVSQVMTPRISMIAVPVDATVEEAKTVMLDDGRLRLPVYQESIDNVVGVLLARDLWRADRDGVQEIRSVMREPRFVPAGKVVEDLLAEMRNERIKMVIVLDEFGGTAGLVTLEDLIEEIVGEIHDEHEKEPLPFEDGANGVVLISGNVPVPDVNERYGLDLPEDVNDTIGGYVFGQIGRVPKRGDVVAVNGGRFTVVATDRRRIRRLSYSPQLGEDGGVSAPSP